MGRKKGKQRLGFGKEFYSKSQHALFRHTLYVDHASEADHHRNKGGDLGRGYGYRSASLLNDGCGGGCGGSVAGGDKWSSIFSSQSNCARASNLGLLRHLLQERRLEDRIHDRQQRLRLQRSRMREAHFDSGRHNDTHKSSTSKNNSEVIDRHEPGWLLSYPDEENHNDDNIMVQQQQNKSNEIPSLQNLAARKLGPLLPMYCAACGSDFVGDSLKSVSASAICEISSSFADWTSQNGQGDAIFATTDGAVKALAHSGVATGLVLRGAPLVFSKDNTKNEAPQDDDDDARLLSDVGLLSLCPRILAIDNDAESDCSASSENDACEHWETLDFDTGLNSRLAGCFYLKRLELIDIPLRQHGSLRSSSGISLDALRTVLRSCSGITHLSLSGCFYNWEDMECLPVRGEEHDISMLLCGNQSISSLVKSVEMFSKLRGNAEGANPLIPQLFHEMFQENAGRENEIPGLDVLLPELQVLDISRCSWVTSGMLVQYTLKFWERASCSTTRAGDNSSNESLWDESQWEKDGEKRCDDSMASRADNTSYSTAQINTSLRHLNICGCIGLLLSSSLDEWRGQGLFEGIDVSTERQMRRVIER